MIADIQGIEGLFLCRNQDLLRSIYNKIPTIIVFTLSCLSQKLSRFVVKNTILGMKHNRNLKQGNPIITGLCLFQLHRLHNRLHRTRIFVLLQNRDTNRHISQDSGTIGQVPESCFIRKQDTDLLTVLKGNRRSSNGESCSFNATDIELHLVFVNGLRSACDQVFENQNRISRPDNARKSITQKLIVRCNVMARKRIRMGFKILRQQLF